MKIAVVNRHHPDDVLGGSELQCAQLQQQWIALGHDVVYLALDGHGTAGASTSSYGPLERLTSSLGLNTFSRLQNLLMAEGIEWVYCRSFNQLWATARAAAKSGVPCIYNTCNITDLDPFVRLGGGSPLATLRGVVNRWLNWSTLERLPVATINREHAAMIQHRGGRARCVYNSMTDRHGLLPIDKEPTIVWIANLKRRKRPELFVDLARELADGTWKFVMVGEIQNHAESYGPMLMEAEQTIPGFHYAGPLSVFEVDELLGRSELLVNTCEPEGFGNNFIQAWLAGCPTLSLEFDADNLMVDGGFGCCPGSYRRLVAATASLMSNAGERREMGQRARESALRRHDPETNAKKYLELFGPQAPIWDLVRS